MIPEEELYNRLAKCRTEIGEVKITWDAVSEDGGMEVRLSDCDSVLFDVWIGGMIVPPTNTPAWKHLTAVVERALGAHRIHNTNIGARSVVFRIK